MVAIYRRKNHCVFLLHVHLVFVTKYRKKVFKQAHLDFMEQVFYDVCKKFETNLIEFNGESDHVHLLLDYSPKFTISDIVHSLKGVSSRYLRLKFYCLNSKYWKNILWSPSYFACSCGGASISKLKKYIQN